MREIKFRAWSNEVSDMFFNGDNYGTRHDTDCVNYARSQDIILMQYTGLKDKNGIEIYEGDIVKHLNTRGYENLSIGAIEWRDNRSQFCHSRYSEECLSGRDLEVIGNIYENPELLEK